MEASYRLGLREQEAGQWERANAYFKQAPDIPGSAEAVKASNYNLALAAQAEGRLQEAADLFLEAGIIRTRSLRPGPLQPGIALSNQRDYMAAEALR